jgi:putative ABC transport system permease protein
MVITAFKIAISALKSNTGRTLLTVLGIVIGITSVIAVLSIGQAIKGLIIGEVESFGTNYVQVEVKTPQTAQASTDNAFSMVGGSVITTLTLDDAEDIEKISNVSKIYGALMGQEVVSFENDFKKAILFGTGPDFIDIDASEIETGRFYSDEEDRTLSKVVVLGSKLKNDIFGDSPAVGNAVKIGSNKFQVIGVLKERGATFGLDMDAMAFVPVRTIQKRVLGVNHVSYIMAQVYDNSIASQTTEEIEYILRANHKITDEDKEDFAVTTMEQAMEMLDVIIVGIQFLLIALGSISLIVGGVGIMNIMYVSVTERTSEIGLRKSIGAKNKNILWQFLAESVMLTLAGGIIGIIIGLLLSFLVSVVAQAIGYEWPFSVSWPGMVAAVLMSIIVGLIFGLYPAKQAAKLDPIESLRYE